MNARRGRVCGLFWGLTAAAVAAGGCARSRQPDGAPESSAPGDRSAAAPPNTAPVDHLAPDELTEGAQKAFGLTLPHDVHITQSFVDLVSATGPVSVHSLVRYLSAHLEGGALREGADAATFEHVRARGHPELELLVHIGSVLGGSRIDIHTVLHPPAAQLPDEASRWRQVGLTPQGKVIDPAHFE
jgi:hypothetical protein